ncbi:MAG: DNA polymerase III subunit beta [Bacteroidota bacterium]
MKFTVAIGELQKCLANIGGVIPSKSTLPILENFLFELNGNNLKITATDLEISMSVSIEVKGSRNGKIAVPAKKLMETTRALPLASLEFQVDLNSNKIDMTTENGEYKLTGESSENYPAIPEFKGQDEITIGNETLRRLINTTLFAVSVDELRPAMMGVLFQISKKELRLAATDGHRLVRFINTSLSLGDVTRDVIIPAKALNLVVKSTDSKDSKISFSERHAMFSLGSITLITKIIEEKYPNYESVLPLDNEKTIIVDKDQLLSSVRRTALYASSTTRQVRLGMTKNCVTVSAEDIDFGSEAHEKLTAEYAADPMAIGFNSSYIVDVLSHINTGRVQFLMSSPSRAAIVKPETQEKGEDILMLVMPVRLNA